MTLGTICFPQPGLKDQMQDLQNAEKWSPIDGPTILGDVPDNWRRATDRGMNGVLTNMTPELREVPRKG